MSTARYPSRRALHNAIESYESLSRFYRACPTLSLALRMFQLQTEATVGYLQNEYDKLTLAEEELRYTIDPNHVA